MNKQAAKLELEAIKVNRGYKSMSDNRWKEVARYENLSENFITVYRNNLSPSRVSYYQEVSAEFVLSDAFDFDYIHLAQNDCITVEEYEKLKHLLPFDEYLQNINADSDFLLKHKEGINAGNVRNICFELLTEEAIFELFPLIQRRTYFYTKTTLTKAVLEKYESQLDWEAISFHSKLTEEALIAFAHRINWENYIWSNPNPVPEQIIKEKNLLKNPALLSQIVRTNKNLSEAFIREHSKWFVGDLLIEQQNAPTDLLLEADLYTEQLIHLFSFRKLQWEDVVSLLVDKTHPRILIEIFSNQDFDVDFYENNIGRENNRYLINHLESRDFLEKNINLNPETKEHIETMEKLKNLFN